MKTSSNKHSHSTMTEEEKDNWSQMINDPGAKHIIDEFHKEMDDLIDEYVTKITNGLKVGVIMAALLIFLCLKGNVLGIWVFSFLVFIDLIYLYLRFRQYRTAYNFRYHFYEER